MATNVSEKNRILDELREFIDKQDKIMDFCMRDASLRGDFYDIPHASGYLSCISHVRDWIDSHYGYSGDMPSEVPNQSEGQADGAAD